MFETVEIPVSRSGIARRRQLEIVLNAQFRVEKWERRGRALDLTIVLLSIPMAYLLLAAAGTRTPGANLVLSLWSLAVVGFAVSAEIGRRARKRLDRLLSESGARRIDTNGPGAN